MAASSTEIRDFITEHFNREELDTFCHDYFRDVYEDYEGTDIGKGAYTRRLVEYCERRDLIKSLLTALQTERSESFLQRFETVKVSSVSIRPRDPKQVFISHAHQDAEFARRLATDLPLMAEPSDVDALSVWLSSQQHIPFTDDYTSGLAQLLRALGVQSQQQFKPEDVTDSAESMSISGTTKVVPIAPDGSTQQQELKTSPKVPSADDIRLPVPSGSPDLLVIDQPFHLVLVRVPAGEFLMGSDPDKDVLAQPEEQPQHRVYLDEYYIGRYLVTNEQWATFARAVRREFKIVAGKDDKYQHPVTFVSWGVAMEFCQWLSRTTGRAFGLPTEAQWEKAARGTDGWIYPWGDQFDATKLNSEEGGVDSRISVGKYSPAGDSPYGCADMVGNVWEWCADWFDEKAYQRHGASMAMNPSGPSNGVERVLRGGSWCNDQDGTRCAYRNRTLLGYGDDYIGFRVVVRSAPSDL